MNHCDIEGIMNLGVKTGLSGELREQPKSLACQMGESFGAPDSSYEEARKFRETLFLMCGYVPRKSPCSSA